jgi:hypothetical protein
MTPDELAKQIPDEVVIPVAWAIYEATTGLKPGDELYEDDGYAFHWEEAVKAIAAALAAWPKRTNWYATPAIILPLKETQNAE